MNKNYIENKLSQELVLVQELIEKAKKAGISNVEVYGAYGHGEEVGLEKSDLNASQTLEETNFGVRVIESGSQGFVTTNNLPTLWESILEAKNLAKSQSTPDLDLVLPAPRFCGDPIDSYHPELDQIELSHLTNYAKELLDWRDKNPLISIDSGGLSLQKGYRFIASSQGVLQQEMSASISASVMGMAIEGDVVGSFDYDSGSGDTVLEFESEWNKAREEFALKCLRSLRAKPGKSFKGYVILPPDYVYSFFLGLFLSSLTGSNLRKGKSKMAGKLGSKVGSELLTIKDEPHLVGKAGSTTFDREGMPTEPLSVLDRGVLNCYFYNTYEAKKAGLKESNGCASGGSSSLPGMGAHQLQIVPGNSDKQEFYKLDRPALVMGRLSGTSQASSGDFSGVIKGGLFIENGLEIPIKEVQIVGNAFEALNQIVAISSQGEWLGRSSFVPYMLLDGFQITGN